MYIGLFLSSQDVMQSAIAVLALAASLCVATSWPEHARSKVLWVNLLCFTPVMLFSVVAFVLAMFNSPVSIFVLFLCLLIVGVTPLVHLLVSALTVSKEGQNRKHIRPSLARKPARAKPKSRMTCPAGVTKR